MHNLIILGFWYKKTSRDSSGSGCDRPVIFPPQQRLSVNLLNIVDDCLPALYLPSCFLTVSDVSAHGRPASAEPCSRSTFDTNARQVRHIKVKLSLDATMHFLHQPLDLCRKGERYVKTNSLSRKIRLNHKNLFFSSSASIVQLGDMLCCDIQARGERQSLDGLSVQMRNKTKPVHENVRRLVHSPSCCFTLLALITCSHSLDVFCLLHLRLIRSLAGFKYHAQARSRRAPHFEYQTARCSFTSVLFFFHMRNIGKRNLTRLVTETPSTRLQRPLCQYRRESGQISTTTLQSTRDTASLWVSVLVIQRVSTQDARETNIYILGRLKQSQTHTQMRQGNAKFAIVDVACLLRAQCCPPWAWCCAWILVRSVGPTSNPYAPRTRDEVEKKDSPPWT